MALIGEFKAEPNGKLNSEARKVYERDYVSVMDAAWCSIPSRVNSLRYVILT
jgi:hypothetical protein